MSMARLQGQRNHVLEIEPVGYEFSTGRCSEDLNWLNVRVACSEERYTWTRVAPAFLTWELQQLVTWCRQGATHDASHHRVSGVVEPNLIFEDLGVGEYVHLRVLFQLELRPPGLLFVAPVSMHVDATANMPLSLPGDAVVVDFVLEPDALAGFATALESELARFPVRTAPTPSTTSSRQRC
jgi:hypothetical protein